MFCGGPSETTGFGALFQNNCGNSIRAVQHYILDIIIFFLFLEDQPLNSSLIVVYGKSDRVV